MKEDIAIMKEICHLNWFLNLHVNQYFETNTFSIMKINTFFQPKNTFQNKNLAFDNQFYEEKNVELSSQSNELSDNSKNSFQKTNSSKRLINALKLLPNISFNISEIAYSLGFNDPKYFSRCFKQEFGLTPREFRELKLKSMNVVNDLYFDEKFITKANEVVLKNIAQYNFGVDELANELNVSYSTLYRKIKTTSGISPCDFIRKTRIKNAMKLLSQKTLSFSDIAYATGFCNYSYFSRCFKSEYGSIPTVYVQKLKHG